MTKLRYVNDYGNGHSGFIEYDAIQITTVSGQPIQVNIASGQPVGIAPDGVAGDAFGRLRTASPLTLFDSSHRYQDNGLWATSVSGSSDATFNANQGLVELNVPTTSGAFVIRETKKVFSYQPGKSLLIMSTFVMNVAKTNLRQRLGYFNAANGLYLELNESTLSFVERSSVTGSVINTSIAQANWNVDKLDGNGPSGLILDITKAQILWFDVEWLGLGTVRAGFVIDGKLIHCHSFHHANTITSTYITTATLPLRYEITNVGTTDSASTLKQVCSTVISEGGYELRGAQRAVGSPVSTPRDLTATGVAYPVVSLRLKASPNRLDAVVIPTAVSILGVGNNGYFAWRLQQGATTSGGTWATLSSGSSVEYNLSGASSSGGVTLAKGYVSSSNMSANSLNIFRESLFQFQLARDGLSSTPEELTILVETKAAGDDAYVAIDWEEVTA